MPTQQLFKGVHNFTYRVNRFALADLENAVLTVDHLIDKHLKRGYADLGKGADGELITTTVDFSITSQFNTLQCGRASDVAIRIEQFSNDRLEAVARLFISDSPKESDKEEICQATVSRQVVNIKGFPRVKEDRNQGNSLIDRQCLIKKISNHNKLTHVCPISVRPQDLNAFGFVPAARFVTYCQHAASHAIYCQNLSDAQNFSHVLQLSRMQVQILSLVNEEDLMVEIWQQNIDNKFIMDFRISGKNGIVCIVAFHIDPQYVVKTLPFYEISLRRPKVYICSCDMPGFFLERDRFNNAKFTEMLRYKVVFDKMTLNIAGISGVRTAYKDGTFFPVKHELEISPAFYSIPSDAYINSTIQIASFNRTSVILEHSIKLQSKTLLVIITKLVSVNHGRTVSIPDNFLSQEAISPLLNKKNYPKDLCPNHIPTKAFISSITFRSDDIDINQHVNNAVYVAVCFDVASKAISSGASCYHTSFGQDFDPACLVKLSTNYYKQCFEHQIVNVFTWQDEQDDKLHFVMKHLSANVFYMTGKLGTNYNARL